jgi:hypothetical protein
MDDDHHHHHLIGGLEHYIFPYIGNNHSNWLMFFRGVANQVAMCGQIVSDKRTLQSCTRTGNFRRHVPFRWQFCSATCTIMHSRIAFSLVRANVSCKSMMLNI